MSEAVPQIRFRFNELKAAQAAAYLLRLAGGRMHGEKLAALLYIVDRKLLISRGVPLTGDEMANESCSACRPNA